VTHVAAVRHNPAPARFEAGGPTPHNSPDRPKRAPAMPPANRVVEPPAFYATFPCVDS